MIKRTLQEWSNFLGVRVSSTDEYHLNTWGDDELEPKLEGGNYSVIASISDDTLEIMVPHVHESGIMVSPKSEEGPRVDPEELKDVMAPKVVEVPASSYDDTALKESLEEIKKMSDENLTTVIKAYEDQNKVIETIVNSIKTLENNQNVIKSNLDMIKKLSEDLTEDKTIDADTLKSVEEIRSKVESISNSIESFNTPVESESCDNACTQSDNEKVLEEILDNTICIKNSLESTGDKKPFLEQLIENYDTIKMLQKV